MSKDFEGSNPSSRTNEYLTIKTPSKSKICSSNYSKYDYCKSIDFTVIDDFRDFCVVEKRLALDSARHYASAVIRLLAYAKKSHSEISIKDIRQYLSLYKNNWSYANQLKGLKTFFKAYLKNPIMDEFVFPRRQFNFNHYMPSKQELGEFFGALDKTEDRALFLFFASSGLRRNEVLDLKVNDVDIEKGVCYPNHQSPTKNAQYGFFNKETVPYLQEWISKKGVRSFRVFPLSSTRRYMPFKEARKKTGLEITPKVLRFWNSNELARLGTPDRYVDAFQGRVPMSVISRHYTDFSLENLKQIYDKADIKVLS